MPSQRPPAEPIPRGVSPASSSRSVRSRFDAEQGRVFDQASHPDFLLAKHQESIGLDYLATPVAKEDAVFHHPRARADDLAEEMVRMLDRVHRFLSPPRCRTAATGGPLRWWA
ncbi:MAG TPA: hypothetical protein VMW47_08115 [Verrucomicrobiae bacterium]|nr:hypothetical protein [Verrucomicrobiae bacterium]